MEKIIKKKGVEKMLFGRCEKKSSHTGAAVMLGALAAIGAISAVCVGKKWVCKKGSKMMSCVRDMMEPENSASCGQ